MQSSRSHFLYPPLLGVFHATVSEENLQSSHCENFSKVSALVFFQYEPTVELTFENVYLPLPKPLPLPPQPHSRIPPPLLPPPLPRLRVFAALLILCDFIGTAEDACEETRFFTIIHFTTPILPFFDYHISLCLFQFNFLFTFLFLFLFPSLILFTRFTFFPCSYCIWLLLCTIAIFMITSYMLAPELCLGFSCAPTHVACAACQGTHYTQRAPVEETRCQIETENSNSK